MDKENIRFTRRQVLLIRQIAGYLDAHPEEQLTLEKLSQLFSMPVSTMKRCFCAVYGMPVCAYLRRSRMKKAAKLLLESSTSPGRSAMTTPANLPLPSKL